jgi:shikimate 5-dehydrogenase
LSRAEQAGYNLDQQALMRSLHAVKIVAAGLVVLGAGGFMLTR